MGKPSLILLVVDQTACGIYAVLQLPVSVEDRLKYGFPVNGPLYGLSYLNIIQRADIMRKFSPILSIVTI